MGLTVCPAAVIAAPVEAAWCSCRPDGDPGRSLRRRSGRYIPEVDRAHGRGCSANTAGPLAVRRAAGTLLRLVGPMLAPGCAGPDFTETLTPSSSGFGEIGSIRTRLFFQPHFEFGSDLR